MTITMVVMGTVMLALLTMDDDDDAEMSGFKKKKTYNTTATLFQTKSSLLNHDEVEWSAKKFENLEERFVSLGFVD